ncbi:MULTISPECIES: sugar kinase [Hymenobacter]|uniref:Sugar kinase n=1 Tax=Hymenobacter jejuensis TaxID=2502781 RepID=A0A5B8A6I2_9BACT|nr:MULTISPECIES: sugar kinase [Hymenobacter]MBC6992046.1 sugar kinase [Hymenobacter sp. BT491]QDA62403.1 sugar kinase [Hymenobacter jejuensis]
MKQVITFGEIMMRLSPPLNYRLVQTNNLEVNYGGGDANVAASVARLGLPAAHVTCFPDNELGYAAAQSFQRYGVSMEHTVFRGDRLGLYFLEVGASMRASKIVYDRFDSAFAKLQPAWFDWSNILSNGRWLHWTGITPAISASAAQACKEAIQEARRRGITVSADVNYRRNLWQYGKKAQDVMPELVAGCDVVVCTEGDAEDLFGITPRVDAANRFVSMAEQLMQRFPQIKQVIATERETLSASHNRLKGVLFNGTDYIETPAYDIVPIVDRIGGGDAFIGGFIYGSLTYPTEQEALTFGVAASALKHTVHGDVNLMTAAEVEPVMQGNTSGRLLR